MFNRTLSHADYLDANMKIMALHPVKNGLCDCGDIQCKALYKHPRSRGWQSTPHWSDEQMGNMEKYGFFATGFGVLCQGFLIIDIDPRNGGNEGYAKLCKDTDTDYKKESSFVVRTGGGGWHIYFKAPEGAALKSHLHDYAGIDFKSSGFVVGCGSMHKSGTPYEAEKGHPSDISDTPTQLINKLIKTDQHRAMREGVAIDVSDSELVDMLSCVSPDCDYETWVKCGMSVHHATGGGGFNIWDSWSAKGKGYESDPMEKKWHSFGKSANPVTLGTLLYHAEKGGYIQPVTFTDDAVMPTTPTDDLDNIDLNRPPGFVGEVVEWINKQSRFPRERLAVAAALSSIGNVCGLRYEDESYGVTANQFIFCVAGSATGKEAILKSSAGIMRAAGVIEAAHGSIKSEQEIVRNLTAHQAAFYTVDEIGIVLTKVANAQKSGSASYLEGVIGLLMSAYSKANDYLMISGDVRRVMEADLSRDLKACRKIVAANEDKGGFVERKIPAIERQLATIGSGLEKPFLSLIGFTTPVTFFNLVNYEQSTNGFIGRSLIFHDVDTNPAPKKRFKAEPMAAPMKMTLASLYSGGTTVQPGARIEHYGDKIKVPTTQDAAKRLDEIEDFFWSYSEDNKVTGLEAISRRAFELVLKVSLVLAAPEGVRTLEHVQWAFATVKRDIDEKINLAAASMATDDKRHDEVLLRRIISMINKHHGETTGVVVNRMRKFKKEDVIAAIAILKQDGKIKSIGTGKSEKWYLA